MLKGITYDYKNASVLVTGGSNGIGLGCAHAYRDAGAKVIITGRKAEANEYDTDLTGMEYRQLDVANRDQLNALADSLNRLDILINNAGASMSAGDEWTHNGFEESVIRYLHGDEVSCKWEPRWEIDKLHIGDYVCIAAEVIILMGGNHNHRTDWFCLYPFMDFIDDSYASKGDTHIHDGAWLGMRSMIMPGVTIGEGAVIAANSVVTKDVAGDALAVARGRQIAREGWATNFRTQKSAEKAAKK